jgi:hypothetical protein
MWKLYRNKQGIYSSERDLHQRFDGRLQGEELFGSVGRFSIFLVFEAILNLEAEMLNLQIFWFMLLSAPLRPALQLSAPEKLMFRKNTKTQCSVYM